MMNEQSVRKNIAVRKALGAIFDPQALQRESAVVIGLCLESDIHQAAPTVPVRPPPPKRANESKKLYNKRMHNWRNRSRRFAESTDPKARAEYEKKRAKLAKRLISLMSDQELVVGYLNSMAPMLTQAYTIAMQKRRIIEKPLGRIFGKG